MNFNYTTNTTSADTGDLFQAPVTLGLASIVAAVISFVAFLSYTPKIDKKSPAFTPERTPFVGSLGFLTKQWLVAVPRLPYSAVQNLSLHSPVR